MTDKPFVHKKPVTFYSYGTLSLAINSYINIALTSHVDVNCHLDLIQIATTGSWIVNMVTFENA